MNLWKLNLHLFGEGGGDGAGAGAAGVAAGGESADASVQGGQAQDGTQQPQRTAEERAQAFEQLIKGEYAEEFNARTQGIISQRFKETKNMQSRLDQMQPLVDALSTRYGETDVQKLMAAIEADEGFYQSAADEAGMTVEQLKERNVLRRKAEAYDQWQAQQQRVETERRAYQQWETQSQNLKSIYPDFDFAAQCKDPQNGEKFIKLLGQGVDVKTAYEVLNHDKLIAGALKTAVNQAQMRTVQTIQAQGMRPSENGVGGSVATQIVKIDPAKMSKKERADYARRALQGERIDFTQK